MWDSDDLSATRSLRRPAVGAVHVRRQVHPAAIVVLDIRSQHAPQMSSPKEDDRVRPAGIPLPRQLGPVLFEALALPAPAKDHLGSHEDKCLLPVVPDPREKAPQRTIRPQDLRPPYAAVMHAWLVAQSRALCMQAVASAKEGDDVTRGVRPPWCSPQRMQKPEPGTAAPKRGQITRNGLGKTTNSPRELHI